MNETKLSESIGDENVNYVLDFLKENISKIDFHECKEAVLVLGPRRSGKTTLTHLLADDNDKLYSTAESENANRFYIIDDVSKIKSEDFITSQNTIPELVRDKGTKTTYIDCPGFNENRNEVQDITLAYFIAKVLKEIKNVKILLVFSNSLIDLNGDHDNLISLLQHVSVLLKNIDKYVDSVGLVVTTVDNKFSEENIKNRVFNKLNQAKKFLIEEQKKGPIIQPKHVDVRKQLQDQIKLVDSLMQLDSGNNRTSKIGILRRPNQEGKLSTISLLQEDKKMVKNMIASLKYSTIEELDIGYAVSAKSKNIIRNLITKTNEIMVSNIGSVNEIIIDYHNHLEAKIFDEDAYTLLKRFEETYTFLKDLRDNIEKPGYDWITQYRANLDEPPRRASKYYLDNMASLRNFSIFLQQVSETKAVSYAWMWIEKLDHCIHHVENSIKWYQFVITLYEILSKYEVQKNRSIYTIPKLDQHKGPLEKSTDFLTFMKKLQDSNLFKMISFQDLQKLTIDTNKIRYFNKVIETTMNSTVSYQSFDKGQRLQITGDYIKFSDLVNNEIFQASKSAQILATHTVFIDANLSKENDLLIIAPQWEIIDSRVISLDGSFGPFHETFRAPSDTCSGRGTDGVPGNAGESAGHFFGIGMNFKNPEKLTISAVGGPGGNGQHGGDGLPGKNSANARPLEDSKPHFLICPYDMSCNINFTHKGTSNFVSYSIEGLTSVEMRVLDGGRGGDCGFGGGPGLGGNEGTVEILNLGSKQFSVDAKIGKGSDGLFGLHGRVGKGGAGGNQYKINYIFQDDNPFIKIKSDSLGQSMHGDPGSCSRSKNPSYSYSEFNKNQLFDWNLNEKTTSKDLPKSPSEKSILYKFSEVMSFYRTLLVNNFSHCVKKRQSLEFYSVLLQNEYISKNDSITGISLELEHLSMNHNKFTEDINRILYMSLQMRLQTLEKTMSCAERSQHHDLMNYLFMETTSKLIRFETTKIPQMVSDHGAYFNGLETTDVDKIFNYFATTIKDESQKFTSNLIQTMDFEIFNFIEDATRHIIELSDLAAGEQLTKQLQIRKLLSNFKTMNSFLKLCRSLAISDVELANAMDVTKIVPSGQPYSLPINGEMVMRDIGAIEKILHLGSDAAELEIFRTINSFNSMKPRLDHVTKQILEIQQILQSHETIITSSYRYPLFSKSSNVLQKINNINLKEIGEVQDREAYKVIKKLQNAIKLIAFDPSLYYRMVLVENHNLENVVSAIDEINSGTSLDKSAEIEIFNIMSNVLIIVRGSLKGKWYKPEEIMELREIIIEALTDMKSYLDTMANNYETPKNFQSLTENFEEAVILLLNTYQGILPTYHDRALLNKLHSYFEIQKTTSIVHKNHRNMLETDILFYEYERLVEIYKKSIFPLDISVSEAFSLPAPVTGEISPEKIISNIRDLESKLKKFEKLKTQNKIAFFSIENLNGTFFTWKHDVYGDLVEKLLRGEKVALKATISKHDPNFLTFNDIRLQFNFKNSTTQTEFNNQLRNFKVIMTHSGNSYFNLCDHIHLYSQAATNYMYHFEKGNYKTDSHLSKRQAQSPFTTWIFEMKPIRSDVTFESMEPFSKYEIDLELEGNAEFIKLKDEKVTCPQIETRIESNSEEMLPTDLNTEVIDYSDDIFLDKIKRCIFFSPVSHHSFINIINRSFPPPEPDWITRIMQQNVSLPASPPTPSPCQLVKPLDVNSALVLADYIIRNITNEKLLYTVERSVTPAQARMAALAIIDEFKAKMTEEQWEAVDPVQLMSKLERNILDRKIKAISNTLTGVVKEISVELERMRC